MQLQDAFLDGVIQVTPSTGTHMLHPRPIEDQRGTDYHEKKRDPISASRPGMAWHGPCDDEKGSSPGGEYIPGRNMNKAYEHDGK